MKIGNLEVYGVIYKIQNKVNNKIYIGQTTIGFYARYGNSLEKHTHNSYLKRSIEKYGINNFDINEIFDIAFSKEELDIKEILWISYFRCTDKRFGYNNMNGGSYGKHSKETKIKMSNSRKGVNNPWYGKHPTIESRLKMRKARKGMESPRKGAKLSKSTKEKISKNSAKVWKGRHLPDNVKKKISEKHLGMKHTEESKIKIGKAFEIKVICLETKEVFESAKKAQDKYGKYTKICECCKGKRKSSGKLENGIALHWMYYSEYLKQK